MVNLKHYVEPTDVNFEWIIEHLDGKERRWDRTRKYHNIAKVEYQLVKDVGFLSNVFRITVHFRGSNFPFNVFLKVPTIEPFRALDRTEHKQLIEEMIQSLVDYHNQEICFYQILGNRYAGFVIPKLFGFEHSDAISGWHGRLLLSDVSQDACAADGINGVSIAQCCSAIETIAKFHAFVRYTSDADLILKSMNNSRLLDLTDKQLQISRRIIALHENYFVLNMLALQKLFESAHLQFKNPHLKFNIKAVISHGDYTFKNVLYKEDDKGRPSARVFSVLDWQNCHVGTGINDVARFVLTSTSAQVQQMCTDRFVKLYYETFQRELKKHGHEAGFCLNKLWEMYWFHYDHELIFALSFLTNEAIKSRDTYTREKIIQRMIAAFEPVREKYEKMIK